MTGTPIVAAKTGGLTRQVCNSIEGGENGVALDIDLKTLVGSQTVPFIYEDYVHNENFAKAIMKLYNMPVQERKELSRKVKNYADNEFNHQKTIDDWHDSMLKTINVFKDRRNWQIEEI